MKKIMIIGCALTLALVSTNAFAAEGQATFDDTGVTGTAPSDTNSWGPLADYKTSRNVEVALYSAAGNYAAKSKHLNGNRTFGLTSAATAIYYQEDSTTVGEKLSNSFTESDSKEFATGWSSL